MISNHSVVSFLSDLRPVLKCLSRSVAILSLVISPGLAQAQPSVERSGSAIAVSQDEGLENVGRTAETGAGEVGERQAPREFGDARRIQNRIQNRVQNRLRTRIDRTYRSGVDTTSSFETAGERYRNATDKYRNRENSSD